MSTDAILKTAQQQFDQAATHFTEELRRLQIGRASSGLVEHVDIEAYGTVQPLKNLASISIPDSRTIQIQPWDSSIIPFVEKAIRSTGFGFNPSNDGKLVRIPIPPLTEERRKDLTKLIHASAEEARIVVRNARHEAHSSLRELEKHKQIGEDDLMHAEKRLQEFVDKANSKIDQLAKNKEEEMMQV